MNKDPFEQDQWVSNFASFEYCTSSEMPFVASEKPGRFGTRYEPHFSPADLHGI